MDEPEALPHDIKAGESPCRKEGRDMKPQVTLNFKWPPYGVKSVPECTINVGGSKRHPMLLQLNWLYENEKITEYGIAYRHPGGLVKGREIRRIR